MRKSLWIASAVAMLVASVPACANKKFVRAAVGEVNSKVDSLNKTVEDTQDRTKKNEVRIGQVDQKAEAAADSATSAAAAANAAAAAARDAGTKVTAVDSRVAAVEKAAKRLLLEVTLNEDQGNFKSGKAELPDAAKARIDQVINQLKADPKSVYIEIEGHTDNTGDAESNHKLGLERAESVRRYIYEQHQVPLNRISVISYGEDKPVAPNKTAEGRAQNRRVVLRMLS